MTNTHTYLQSCTGRTLQAEIKYAVFEGRRGPAPDAASGGSGRAARRRGG